MINGIKKSLSWVGFHLLRSFPRNWIVHCGKLCWKAAAERDAEKTLLFLFHLQDELLLQINQAAIEYGNGIHPKHRIMQYHDFFCKRIEPRQKVLDIGCGYGAVAKSMADRGAIVTGIDIDEDNIKQARLRYHDSNITFICCDATRYFPSDQYNVIVLSNVIEHIRDRQSFMEDLLCRVRPQQILLRVPLLTRDWSVIFRKELALPYFSDPSHFVEYTPDTFLGEMKACGLVVVEMVMNWGEIWAAAVPVHPNPPQAIVEMAAR